VVKIPLIVIFNYMSGRPRKVSYETLPPVVSWWLVPDVLTLLLEDKRSQLTRKAYGRDIKQYF
jgi:hypothetical protein